MSEQPKVIIRCCVYNHEPYLRDCIEGFVMQQTNFPFKAVVHDDCSTDNSAAIIREYAEKYPHIIEPMYETENQYSKWDGSLGRIMNAASLNRSPYIAYCEGDDYWIDPLKLQKQVDFLDNNPDYSMCFSACKIRKEGTNDTTNKGENITDRDYTATDMFRSWIVPTASICVRSEICKDERIVKFDKRKLHGDIILILTAAHYGKVRGMKDKMVVYRVNATSVTQNKTSQLRSARKCLAHYNFLKEKFPLLDQELVDFARFISQIDLARNSNFQKKERILALLRAFFICPSRTLRILFGFIKAHKIKAFSTIVRRLRK